MSSDPLSPYYVPYYYRDSYYYRSRYYDPVYDPLYDPYYRYPAYSSLSDRYWDPVLRRYRFYDSLLDARYGRYWDPVLQRYSYDPVYAPLPPSRYYDPVLDSPYLTASEKRSIALSRSLSR